MSAVPAPTAPRHPGPGSRERRVRAGLALCGLGLVSLAGVPMRDAAAPDPLALARERARLELRAALDAYRADHGRWPGWDATGRAHAGLVRLQLRHVTDAGGRPLPAGSPGLGPYLPDGVPVEPRSGSARLVLARPDGDDGAAPDPELAAARGGWRFDPVDGTLEALDGAPAPRPHPER